MIVPRSTIEFKRLSGWSLAYQKDWAVLHPPSGHATLAVVMYDQPSGALQRRGEVAALLGLPSVKWDNSFPAFIGPDNFPTQNTLGSASLGQRPYLLSYTQVTTGIPQQVAIVWANDGTATQAELAESNQMVQSMRRKR